MTVFSARVPWPPARLGARERSGSRLLEAAATSSVKEVKS